MSEIEKKAREYANDAFARAFSDREIPWNAVRDIFEQTFLAGAAYTLGNQWRDAEKEKPEDGQECLCALRFTSHIKYCLMMFIANPKAWVKDHDDDGFTEHVIAWLPIPEYEPKGDNQ